MLVKHTYSLAGVWKPTDTEKEKKISGSNEVTCLKLSSGGGAATVAIYDATVAAEATPSNLKWWLDCSTTDNDINVFASPLSFTKGVYAVCEQGWDFNPVVCISVIGRANPA